MLATSYPRTIRRLPSLTRRVIIAVIRSFRCRETETLFVEGNVPRFRAIENVATRKLDLLDSAASLSDLRVPPGNRLEALAGDRRGQHSLRINSQFRICFVWRPDGPHDVEIVDFHR